MQKLHGKLPDAVVACVGGGSNASGMFYPFVKDLSVKLLGVEAGGDGINTPRHSATLSVGSPGVLHGVKTYLLQSNEGQILETHSVKSRLFKFIYHLRYPQDSITVAWDLNFHTGKVLTEQRLLQLQMLKP